MKKMAKKAIAYRDDQLHSCLAAWIKRKLSYCPANPKKLIHSVTDKLAKTVLLSANIWHAERPETFFEACLNRWNLDKCG